MRHKTITFKILLTILVFGAITWIGGTIVRSAIAYDLFVPGKALELKNWYSLEQQLTIVSVFRIAGFYTIVGFCLTFASSITIFIYLKEYLRKKGWLFMALILIFLTAPVELYLIYCDLKIIFAFNNMQINSFNDAIIQKYFLARYKHFTVPSALSFLASISAVFLLIWRPLDKPLDEIKGKPDSDN
jgi:hypothetical protein